MKHILRIISATLPVIAVSLLVLQVIVSNETATLGNRLGQLDIAVSDASDIHEALATEVASASSLLTLHERALSLGFHEPAANQIVVLSPEVPVAFGTGLTQTLSTKLP